MINGKRVIAILPARGGSQRLKHKNIYPIWGHPMISWGIRACKASQYIDQVFVTSEDEAILAVAREYGAEAIVRPEDLAGHTVFKMHAISHATQAILDNSAYEKPSIVVCLQPNSPEVQTGDIDKGIEKLDKYDKQEIFSVDSELNQNAAFRVLTLDAVFQKDLSTNCGVIVTESFDVHTLEDVERLEKTKQPPNV